MRVERVGQRHVAVPVVVAVGLAVGGDVHELGRPRVVGEGAERGARRRCSPFESSSVERDGARDRPVVEEDRDRRARGQRHAVRPASGRSPVPRRSVPGRPRRSPRTCAGLVRREDREDGCPASASASSVAVSTAVSGSHMPSGAPPEAVLEVADRPRRPACACRARWRAAGSCGCRAARAPSRARRTARALSAVGREDRARRPRAPSSSSQDSSVGPKLKLIEA